jgi:hypothetical protein
MTILIIMMMITIYVLVSSDRKVLQSMLIDIRIMHEEFVRSRD